MRTSTGTRTTTVLGTAALVTTAAVVVLGLAVTPPDVTQGDLSGFDAIILGARAYAVRPELKSANNRLLEYVKAGGVLEGIEDFDATYFGLSHREAQAMDPQQRFFLECAVEALEHASVDPDRFSGAIGVFGGVGVSTYLHVLESHPGLIDTALNRIDVPILDTRAGERYRGDASP